MPVLFFAMKQRAKMPYPAAITSDYPPPGNNFATPHFCGMASQQRSLMWYVIKKV